MAQTSPRPTLNLPLWFINLCHWFWNKKGRVAGIISGVIGAFLTWFIEQVLTTTEANRKRHLTKKGFRVLETNRNC